MYLSINKIFDIVRSVKLNVNELKRSMANLTNFEAIADSDTGEKFSSKQRKLDENQNFTH